MSDFAKQMAKIQNEYGFIAALDQSGGSTPKALGLYGVKEDQWTNDDEMFDQVHAMRSRIVQANAFNGNRVIGAILFEGTMDKEIGGMGSAEYLWTQKNVVPFVKVDEGLADEKNDIQLMAPISDLDGLLARAREKGIFGTKMRSVIKQANESSIKELVEQQFEIGKQIIAGGLVPILEPEVDINCPEKQAAEDMLKTQLLSQLDKLNDKQLVMFKLTLPETGGHYQECIAHRNLIKVVALSGGYSREEANRRLEQNPNMVASFSRALVEGLTVNMSDGEFNNKLDGGIDSIYQASKAKAA